MKKWLNKFRQIMLYGGLEKEQYRMISKDIDEANRKSVVVLSTACMLIYLLRMNIFNTNIPTINRILFLTAILASGGIAIVNSRVKGNGRLQERKQSFGQRMHWNREMNLVYTLLTGLCRI